MAYFDMTGDNPDGQRFGQEAEWWERIREADARLRQIEVVWNCTRIQPPYPPAYVETLLAQSGEQARMAMAQSPPDLAWTEQAYIEQVQRRAKGSVSHTRLSFLSDGKTTRAEVVDTIDTFPGLCSHVIDIFDGENNIQLMGTGAKPPMRGDLTRDRTEKLSFSAPGIIAPLSLFASPLLEVFTPHAAAIWEGGDARSREPGTDEPTGADDSVTLEQTLPYNYPAQAHLTVSKQHWRPTRLTLMNAATRRIHTRYELGGYREHAGGVWFPDTILDTMPGPAGTLPHSTEYQLESARFNGEVDVMRLYPPVPPGTEITDFRFGPDAGICYKVTTRLPDDAWVRRQLWKQKPGYTVRQTRVYQSLRTLLARQVSAASHTAQAK